MQAADSDQGFGEPVGLQLYSLRDIFSKDTHAGVEQTQKLGFELVETYSLFDLSTDDFKKTLADHGLKPVSGHFGYDRWKNEPEAVIAEAKALGLEYAGCAWISHEGAFDEAEARDAIAVFNRAGEIGAKEGVRVFYHTHGYEFFPYGDGTLMDLIINETKPEWVTFQMDVLWVQFPGQDPAAWLLKYPNRWELMHIKDLKKGVETGSLSGHTDVANNVPIGTGQTDWPAVLKAAKEVGVKYYFIEDESPSVVEQIPQSLKYLKDVKL